MLERACKIPIVPVQVVPCEAPFLIFRLHQIDFRRLAESEAAYQAGLNQICAAIAEAIQSRKSPERLWRPSPSHGILLRFYWKSESTSSVDNGSFEKWTNGVQTRPALRF